MEQILFNELLKSGQHVSKLFTNLQIVLWSRDLVNNTLTASSAVEELYGFTPHECFHNPQLWNDYVIEEDKHLTSRHEANLLSGKSSTATYRIKNKRGEVIYVEQQGIPVFNELGELIKINGYVKDVTMQKKMEKQINQVEQEYRQLIEFSPLPILLIEKTGKIIYTNHAVTDIFNLHTTSNLIGTSIFDYIIHDKELTGDTINHLFNFNCLPPIRLKIRLGNGMQVEFDSRSAIVQFNGRLTAQLVLKETTEEKSEDLFSSNIGTTFSRLGTINEVVCGEFNEPVSIITNHSSISISNDYYDTHCKSLHNSRQPVQQPESLTAHSGSTYAKQQLEYLAYHDSLTKLPNRARFYDYIKQCIDKSKQSESVFTILFIDLDGFKVVNDTFGHTFGDKLLQEVANRLRNAVGESDFVARIGGDEFVVLSPEARHEAAHMLAESIITTIGKPFNIEHHEIHVTPSIGINYYPEGGEKLEILLNNADTAMYLAKERGKNKYQCYTKTVDAMVVRRRLIEQGLKTALENSEMYLIYQPQFDLNSNKIIGAESLLRWEHPQLGKIPPAEFIPIAEETGHISSIGEFIFKEACKQNMSWQSSGFAPICIGINVSVKQLGSPRFIETVKAVISETLLAPEYLQLEITESIMQNIQDTLPVIKELKQLGIKIAIDNFGTGYSSLSYIKQLDFDCLKIDRSFVHNIAENTTNAAIIKSILELGSNLNIKVIAEGIERDEELKYLKDISCKYGQGFYFKAPLSAESLESELKKEFAGTH